MRTNHSRVVARELGLICERAGIFPKYLLSDNGVEFKDEVTQFCKTHDIKQRFTRTYSPQANGIAERTNREVRKFIRAYMLKNNNLNWTKVLGDVERDKNQAYNTSIKAAPEEVWVANKDPVNEHEIPEVATKADKGKIAKAHVLRRVMAQIQKFRHEDDYAVGDRVRVKMSSIFSNVRALIKSKDTKQIVVTYSPRVYTIARVIIPRRGLLERRRYILARPDGVPIKTPKGQVRDFYASELIAAKDAKQAHISMERALKLNGVEPNRHDLVY